MSVGSAIRKFFADRSTESHTIRDDDYWGAWAKGENRLDPIHAGVAVSQEGALRVSTVWRCVDLISGTLAGLPADAVRKRGTIREEVPRKPMWLEFPNPETNWYEFCERIFECLLMDGNAFILIAGRDSSTYPAELWTLNPRDITVRKENGRIFFLWGKEQTRLSRYGPSDLAGDVLHIKLRTFGGLRGLSPISAMRQSLGLSLVTEKTAATLFGKGMQIPWGVQLPAQPTGGIAASREHVELMRDTLKAQHSGPDNAWKPMIATGGATFFQLGISSEDAQFLQTRSFQVEDIATRFFGIPAHLVGLSEKQTSFGTGVEQASIGLVRFTLLSHIIRFESAMSQLMPRGQFLRLNQRGLLRADSETEAKVLAQKLQNGVINFNRWRELDDEPPRPGGDRYMIPGNMKLLESSGLPAPVPAPLQGQPPPSPNGNGQVQVPVNVGGD